MSVAKLVNYFASIMFFTVLGSSGTGDEGVQIGEKIDKNVTEVAEKINQSETAQDITAGILQPIYDAAEFLAMPGFYWVAFMLMAAGIVSFALQLVLGKLVMLTKLHFSLMEILSDGLGLAISAVGLVLTTQAAAENSTFTQSPALVLSATAVGAFLGFIFYLQGQSQEIKAAKAKKQQPV